MMPRINVEDCWFDDPRRESLCQKLGPLGDAIALRMWRLAQNYYRVKTLVPVHIFESALHWREFEEVGLAERRPEGVYVKGRGERFAWLAALSESGTRGGKTPKKNEWRN